MGQIIIDKCLLIGLIVSYSNVTFIFVFIIPYYVDSVWPVQCNFWPTAKIFTSEASKFGALSGIRFG